MVKLSAAGVAISGDILGRRERFAQRGGRGRVQDISMRASSSSRPCRISLESAPQPGQEKIQPDPGSNSVSQELQYARAVTFSIPSSAPAATVEGATASKAKRSASTSTPERAPTRRT